MTKQPTYSKVKAVAVSGATVAGALAVLALFGIEIPIDPQLIADNINAVLGAIVVIVTVVNTVAGWFKTERIGGPPVVNVGEPSDEGLSESARAEIENSTG